LNLKSWVYKSALRPPNNFISLLYNSTVRAAPNFTQCFMKLFKILIIAFFFSACSEGQPDKNSSVGKTGLDTTNDIYAVEADDIFMNAAINKAKETMDEFDKALKSNRSTYSGFALKKRYNTPDGGGEHMWIGGIVPVNGKYKGIVNNDAETTNEVKYGDTVIVRRDEITDWMYLENNVLRGGYTIRAIRNKLTKEEQEEMDKELGFKIE
jgi:uncharacterized protein YegJ (DUF2314 family)